MIEPIITILDAATENLPIDTRHGLASIVGGQPGIYAGNGDFVPVVNDLNGSWSYYAITGTMRAERRDIGEPCAGLRVSVPLRLVMLLSRPDCGDLTGLLMQAAGQIREARKVAAQAVGAKRVSFDSTGIQIDAKDLGSVIIPTGKVLVAMDINVNIEAAESCFQACEVTSVLCALISKASNAQVVECLGPERVAQICDSEPIECDPLTWEQRNSEGTLLNGGSVTDPCGETLSVVAPDATVLRDGQAYGTVPSGGTIDVPSNCEPCPVTVRIWYQGDVKATVPNLDPCGDNEIIITCEDLT